MSGGQAGLELDEASCPGGPAEPGDSGNGGSGDAGDSENPSDGPGPAGLDLLVVGAGPTGIAIGAEARQAGLSVLLVDRGPLTAAIQAYPTFLEFFTTRERLEIAGIPFSIPEVKPSRRQALVYYRSVAERYKIPLALYEDVVEVRPHRAPGSTGSGFEVLSAPLAGEPGARLLRRARAVAVATGYFDGVKRLGVPGEDLPWVHHRYVEAYPFYSREVVVVGAGNTAAEAALDLWRNGARVTLVHRRSQVKPGVKYWLKPDLENRIAEGSITARFDSEVRAFHPAPAAPRPPRPLHPPLSPITAGAGPAGQLEISGPSGRELLPADAVFVLIGYVPDAAFLRRCGVDVAAESLVPACDPETCESNVPGLYIAGTIQAGRQIDRIFIENSREHAPRIVRHLAARLSQPRERVRP